MPTPSSPGPERAALAAVAVVAALVGLALVASGPDHSTSSDAVGAVVARADVPTTMTTGAAASAPTSSATVATPAAPTSSTTARASAPPTSVDPGTLPQTEDRPSASGAQFDAGVQGLWAAIVADEPARALPFFFPEAAYVQVKAISDPTGDYQARLIANYQQDIHALHAQLGSDASRAQLTDLSVPGDQAVWVQPGAEYNKGSYWRVYGSTLRYTVDGQTRSFPVSSLISWRGQWYVVHLGEIR